MRFGQEGWLLIQKSYKALPTILLGVVSAFLTGCGSSKAKPAAEAPPSADVIHESNAGTVQVDHPERFQLVAAGEYQSAATLNATGSVSPDVSRQVPVISLASGRVVDIRARLGDGVAATGSRDEAELVDAGLAGRGRCCRGHGGVSALVEASPARASRAPGHARRRQGQPLGGALPEAR